MWLLRYREAVMRILRVRPEHVPQLQTGGLSEALRAERAGGEGESAGVQARPAEGGRQAAPAAPLAQAAVAPRPPRANRADGRGAVTGHLWVGGSGALRAALRAPGRQGRRRAHRRHHNRRATRLRRAVRIPMGSRVPLLDRNRDQGGGSGSSALCAEMLLVQAAVGSDLAAGARPRRPIGEGRQALHVEHLRLLRGLQSA